MWIVNNIQKTTQLSRKAAFKFKRLGGISSEFIITLRIQYDAGLSLLIYLFNDAQHAVTTANITLSLVK
ncbi:MAG: hypothetical protein DWQ10_16025 [Calditrichaeota bacterium]|nr:MAG: hypothetical protein DWQ10_16025 [Calditrichota bacterium]